MTLADIKSDLAALKEQVASFISNKPNAEQLEAAQADWGAKVSELGDQVKAAEAKESDHAEQLKSRDSEIDALKTEIAELKAEKETAETEHAKEVEEVKESTDKKASAKAAQIASSQGIPSVAVQPGGAAIDESKNVLEQWQSIEDPKKKTAFFQKHRAEIMRRARPSK